jgi:glutathione S-transferase
VNSRTILFDKPECPFCWRVRMALHRCNIDFERRDFADSEAEWKSLTSAGTVPVLQMGDLLMTDSSVMLEYLNDSYGGLWPAAAKPAAKARATSLDMDRLVGVAVRDLVFQRRDRPAEAWDQQVIDQAIEQWRQVMPDLEQRLGEADYFIDNVGITDYVLATRFGLAMAYGMPRPESARMNGWYDRISHRSEFQMTAPPRVIEALDRGWQV